MRHLARRAYLIILIVIATINQWHCYFISEAGRRCWIHWMHIIQDIQLCATIDRFRSGRRKEKRERKTIEHCDRPHNSNQAIPFLHYYFRMLFKWNKTNNKMLQFKNQIQKPKRKAIWTVFRTWNGIRFLTKIISKIFQFQFRWVQKALIKLHRFSASQLIDTIKMNSIPI